MHTRSSAVALGFAVFAICSFWPNAAEAYTTYDNGSGGNCAGCHGDYRDAPYVSLTDGSSWGDSLHNVHRSTMLGGDCATCHTSGGRSPVLLNSSNGGSGLPAISCVGCHGRDEGSGVVVAAGLRQHHYQAAVTVCAACHSDANPTVFTTVGEDILAPYYASPGTGHPAIPVDSCNPLASEDFAGSATGLDNDGDGVYDTADTDCAPACTDVDMDTFSPDGGACGPVDCDDGDGSSYPGATELCDGIDNDCDGPVDEGLSQGCSTACGSGTETCAAGAWGSCDAPTPTAEVCDGVDNDCDGTIDDGLTRTCISACGAGAETCSVGAWGTCDAPTPTVEVCDGVDNDCDGTIDDGLTRTCSTACGSGSESCSAGAWAGCDAPAPAAETCDGADNNCDGTIDEGCTCIVGVTQSCGSDVGECEAGLQTCESDGTWGAICAGSVEPAAETCNDLDDDCDGAIDQGLTQFCTSACGTGSETCTAGAWLSCSAPEPVTEVCDDAIDNDCDGTVDEDCPPPTDGGVLGDGGTMDGGTLDSGAVDDGGVLLDSEVLDDGGVVTDGGVTDGGATDGGATDGGTTDSGATDGGATDGGATTDSPDDGGCGCATPGAPSNTGSGGLLLLLGLVGIVFRRRRCCYRR